MTLKKKVAKLLEFLDEALEEISLELLHDFPTELVGKASPKMIHEEASRSQRPTKKKPRRISQRFPGASFGSIYEIIGKKSLRNFQKISRTNFDNGGT